MKLGYGEVIMSLSMVILTALAVLIFFGVLQRVLDRMYLTDRQALLITFLMFVGTLLPDVSLGPVSVNLGGAVIPVGVCIYLLIRCDEARERIRALLGSVLAGAAIFGITKLLPPEAEELPVDPMLLYGLAGGVIAWVMGRSRRGAFICGVLGMILADVATGVMVRMQGASQQLVLGGAGVADAVVLSGVFGVIVAEIVGEITERIVRRKKRRETP